MSDAPAHRHARLHIGADPNALPADVVAHLESCAACRQFLDETRAMEARLQAALGLPLTQFRRKPAPTRRFALAASVVLGLLVAGGAWLFRPSTALAAAVVAHVEDEADSWNMQQPLPPAEVADILRVAKAQFDSPYPIVYGFPCPFQGSRVAHLVLMTGQGTMTVMLIPHEQVRRRTTISQHGMHGVLVPVGSGSVALLTRDGAISDEMVEKIVSRVRW
jgi:hypothetical protein